ncbi:MAG: hypothetical protein R2684_04725 [Pyrinomonadaceae bacterium]
MGLKERMVRILQSSETQRIRLNMTFPAGTAIEINGESFTRVATALNANRIHVQEGGVPDGVAKYSARVEGASAANTFYIGANSFGSRDFAGLIVHEAVHAFFDLTSGLLPWLDNEAAAYVAQGMYLRHSGFPMSRFNTTSLAYFGREIAGCVARGEDYSFWMDALRDGLRSDPLYSTYINGHFTGDG